MKRAAAILLIATLSFGIISGCGNGGQEAQSGADTAQSETDQLETAQPDASQEPSQTAEAVSPEDILMNYTVKDLELNDVALADYVKGNKLTMINFWGTFCGPCIREMPDLAKLSEANKANGVEVVGIVIDILDRKGNVDLRVKKSGEAIIKQTGANYTHIIPSKEMFSGVLKDVQAVPTTIFVDSNGTQIGEAHLGARSQKDWQKLIDEILKK